MSTANVFGLLLAIFGNQVWFTQSFNITNECYLDGQCSGVRNNISLDIYCYGYQSCYNSDISAESGAESISCYASHSCADSQLEGYDVWCEAAASCMDSDITATDDVYCAGAYSCYNSVITTGTANPYVDCYGDNSCRGASITTNRYAEGYGAYSLVDATITPSYQSSYNYLYIYLYGYFAGYGLSIDCGTIGTCELECYGNACYNTEFLCNDTITSCYIYCDETIGDYCPNGYGNDSYIDKCPGLNEYKDLLGNPTEILSIFDNICDSSISTTLLCDDYEDYGDNGCAYNTNLDGINFADTTSFCCRGYESCYDSFFPVYDNAMNLVCTGEYSCDNANFTIINNKKNPISSVYCGGYESCYEINGQILSNTDLLYLGSEYALEYPMSDIYNVSLIYSSSYESFYEATIHRVNKIIGLTYESISDVYIYSDGIGKTELYCIGYMACYDVYLYCNQEDDDCYVYCLSSESCYDVYLYCGDGNCHIYCDQDWGCPSIESGEANHTEYLDFSESYDCFPTPLPTTMPSDSPSDEPTLAPVSNQPSIAPTIMIINDMETTEEKVDETDYGTSVFNFSFSNYFYFGILFIYGVFTFVFGIC